jgi:hypothetical protein
MFRSEVDLEGRIHVAAKTGQRLRALVLTGGSL